MVILRQQKIMKLSHVFMIKVIDANQHIVRSFMNIANINIIALLYYIDTVEVKIKYANETFNTSDVKNPLFPLAEEIEIQSGTKVEFSCNISNCTWNIESTNLYTITENQLTIETIKKVDEGTYSLIRKTTNGQTYLTAQVYISVISSGQQPVFHQLQS